MPIEPPPTDPKLENGAPAPDANAPFPGSPDLLKRLLEDVPDDPQSQAGEPEPKPDAEKMKKEEEEKARLAEEERKKKETADPGIKVRKPPAAKRPDLPIARAPRAPEPKVQAPTPAASVDDSDLEENERQAIKDAEEIERRMGDRHKGLAEKTRKYIRGQIEFIKTHGADEFDDQSPEYLRWVENNRPNVSAQDIRELSEARIAERAQEGPMKELQRLRHERFTDREEPVIEREAAQVFNQLANTDGVVPAEIREELKTRPYPEVYKEYKLELDTVNEVLGIVKDRVKEFNRLMKIDPETKKPMQAEITDPKDPKFALHEGLRAIVRNVGQQFLENGGDERIRDGRWFVTKAEYFRLKKDNPEALSKYWTFSNKEILARALRTVPQEVAAAIAFKRKNVEDLGYVRPPKVKPKEEVKVEPRKPASPPARQPSPVPAAGGSGEAVSEGAKLAAAIGRDNG